MKHLIIFGVLFIAGLLMAVGTITKIGGDQDTNETTRFDNLVGTDCAADNYMYGVDTDGTPVCRADLTGGGSGANFWVDNGTFISPNASYAQDVTAWNFNATTAIYSNDWSNVSITESQVSDADWWDANADLSNDEISEAKIDFDTSCASTSKLYVSGNDLACNADDDNPEAGDVAWTDLTDDGTFTDTKYCTYDSANSRIDCDSEGGEGGTGNSTISVLQQHFAYCDGSNGNTITGEGITCSRTGTGDYTITFDSARDNDDYIILTQVVEDSSNRDDFELQVIDGSQTTSDFDLQATEQDNGGSAGVAVDLDEFYVLVTENETISQLNRTDEEVQDAVLNIGSNGDGVDFTYDDGGNSFSLSFDCSDVDGNGLSCNGEDLELTYAMNQDVESTDAVTFATVNTGQGANELYDMDQNVQTTDSPEFAAVGVGTSPAYEVHLEGTGEQAIYMNSSDHNDVTIYLMRGGDAYDDYRIRDSGGVFYIEHSENDGSSWASVFRFNQTASCMFSGNGNTEVCAED